MCIEYLDEYWGGYKVYVEEDGVYMHLIESVVCCDHKCGGVWVCSRLNSVLMFVLPKLIQPQIGHVLFGFQDYGWDMC